MGLKSFVIPDIGLGLNTSTRPHDLRPGEAASTKNLTLGPGGLDLALRQGMDPRIDSGADGKVALQSYWWEAANKTYWAFNDGNLRSVGSDPADPYVTIASIFVGDFEVAKDSSGVERLWVTSFISAGGLKVSKGGSTPAWTNCPTSGTICKLWKNRMIVSGDFGHPDRLYYSSIGDPELPAPYNFIDIRSAYDDSEPIVALELIGDNLLVFKENSVWLVYDSNTFANRRLGGPGVWTGGGNNGNKHFCAEWNERVYFLGPGGLHSTDGITAPRLESNKIIDLAYSDPSDDQQSGFLLVDSEKERLLIIRTDQSVANTSRFYEMYFPNSKNNPRKEEVWFFHDFTPDLYNLLHAKVSRTAGGPKVSVILGMGYGGSSIFRLFGETTDDGRVSGARITYDTYWESGWMRIGSSIEGKERIRRINFDITPVEYDNIGNPGHARVNVWVDQNEVPSGSPVGSPAFTGLLFGPRDFQRVRPETRGRMQKISIGSAGNSDRFLALSGIEIIYRGGTEH